MIYDRDFYNYKITSNGVTNIVIISGGRSDSRHYFVQRLKHTQIFCDVFFFCKPMDNPFTKSAFIQFAQFSLI